MSYPRDGWVWPHVVGDARTRVIIVAAVIGLLVVSSGGFVIGMDVGLSLGWIVVALGIAFVAGLISAGLGPTIVSQWLISLWWFVFPPLVGYVGGGWPASRYHHPRMLGFAYDTARDELIGGIEYGVKYGRPFAIIGGSILYTTGAAIPWFATRLKARQ